MPLLRDIFSLLSDAERRRLYALGTGVLVMAFFETVGVASILPFMAVLANPELVATNRHLRWLFENLGFSSVNMFLFFLGAVMFGLLVVSNAVAASVTWAMVRFSWMRSHTLSRRLLAKYLGQPYLFFTQRNTTTLGTGILAEVTQVVTNVLLPLVHITARTLVAVFIISLLIVVDPLLAVVVAAVLGGSYALLYVVVRKRLGAVGLSRVRANRQRFRMASEALSGIKELKLLGREASYLQRYSTASERFSRDQATAHAISELPRYGIEIIAFGGVLLVILYLITVTGNVQHTIPLLSLYAFAGYRLVPALHHVFAGLTKIRANRAALEGLVRDLEGYRTDAPVFDSSHAQQPIPLQHGIELEEVSLTYPDADHPAVYRLNVSIPRNTRVGFVGPTGCGKTTTIDIILGLLRPQHGSLRIDDVKVDGELLQRWQRNVGYVPQQIFLADDTVARNIAFGVPTERIDANAVERAARAAHLHEFITSIPQGYDTVVGERGIRLSGGQRQRIGIARALYHDPAVLVFDEATSAVDSQTERAIAGSIDALGRSKTIIIVAHRLTTVRACDVIYVMEKGRISARGTFDELIASSNLFGELARGAQHAAV